MTLNQYWIQKPPALYDQSWGLLRIKWWLLLGLEVGVLLGGEVAGALLGDAW